MIHPGSLWAGTLFIKSSSDPQSKYRRKSFAPTFKHLKCWKHGEWIISICLKRHSWSANAGRWHPPMIQHSGWDCPGSQSLTVSAKMIMLLKIFALQPILESGNEILLFLILLISFPVFWSSRSFVIEVICRHLLRFLQVISSSVAKCWYLQDGSAKDFIISMQEQHVDINRQITRIAHFTPI